MAAGTVAVLGAGGYIGRHIVDALLGRGRPVRALGRGRLEPAHRQGCLEAAYLDFDSSAAEVAQALEDAACVVHCAGHYEAGEQELASYVDSVRKVSHALRERGQGRLLLVSSIAVYGAASGDPVLTAPTRPETPYGRSRLAAEQAARDGLAGSAVELVILRVPAVVGADMRSDALRRFFRALRFGVFIHPGRADARFACIGVRRLAQAAAAAADSARALPVILQPVDCIPWAHLAQRFGLAAGRRIRRVWVPNGAAVFFSRLLGYDVGRALKALDSPLRYEDNCAVLAGARLPETMEDIDALIATITR